MGKQSPSTNYRAATASLGTQGLSDQQQGQVRKASRMLIGHLDTHIFFTYVFFRVLGESVLHGQKRHLPFMNRSQLGACLHTVVSHQLDGFFRCLQQYE